MIKALFLILGLVGLSFSQTCTTEEAALIAFYNAANGPSWTTNTNWLSTSDYCNWFGVECNKPLAQGGVVVSISLNNNNLSGTVSDQLGCLVNLKTFYINDNPALTWNLTTANVCSLSASLQHLQANNSGLTGTLPQCLCNMNFLQYIYLDNNALTGTIPVCTAPNVITYLRELHLRCDDIEGTLPEWFYDLQFLDELLLSCMPNFTCPAVPPSILVFTCGFNVDDCDSICGITPVSCPDTINIENCGTFTYVPCTSGQTECDGIPTCNIYIPL